MSSQAATCIRTVQQKDFFSSGQETLLSSRNICTATSSVNLIPSKDTFKSFETLQNQFGPKRDATEGSQVLKTMSNINQASSQLQTTFDRGSDVNEKTQKSINITDVADKFLLGTMNALSQLGGQGRSSTDNASPTADKGPFLPEAVSLNTERRMSPCGFACYNNIAGVQPCSPHKKSKSNSCLSRPPLLPPCRVCGDRASGYHYGVNTCEACKGFFRRSICKTGPYVCTGSGSGDCKTSGGKRTSCSYCRFKRCIATGMSKTAIKTGRYTHELRSKNILEVKRLQKQGSDDSNQSFEDVIGVDKNDMYTDCHNERHRKSVLEETLGVLVAGQKMLYEFLDDYYNDDLIRERQLSVYRNYMERKRKLFEHNVSEDAQTEYQQSERQTECTHLKTQQARRLISQARTCTEQVGRFTQYERFSDQDGRFMDQDRHFTNQTERSSDQTGHFLHQTECIKEHGKPSNECHTTETESFINQSPHARQLGDEEVRTSENKPFVNANPLNLVRSRCSDLYMCSGETGSSFASTATVNAKIKNNELKPKCNDHTNITYEKTENSKGYLIDPKSAVEERFGTATTTTAACSTSLYKERLRAEVMTKIINDMEQAVQGMLAFAKCLPGFSELPAQDQASLLKAARFDIWYIGHIRCLNVELRVGACEWQFHAEELAQVWGDSMVDLAFTLSRVAQTLDLTKHETAALRAVCLTFPDRCTDLQNREEVEQIHARMLEVFKFVSCKRHPDYNKWFTKVINFLMMLREFGVKFESVSSRLKLDWSVLKDNPLLLSVFLS